MDLVALQKKLEERYLGYTDTSVTPNVVVPALDTTILSHATAYFLTAQRLYELDDDRPTDTPYPMLTLLALSAELFLKGFHPDVDEKYEEMVQTKAEKEAGDRPIKFLIDKEVHSSKKWARHDLGKLLKSYLEHDKDLYDYLTGRYTIDTGRSLLADLSDYSNTFMQVRYIFEYGKTKGYQYLTDINIIYRLVESLYKSSNAFYTDEYYYPN
ncbi:hypothetical protein [Psychrobacter sp. UBA3068]|jgi:hypothetical protein|uniref:hypothetical protein n=1 Tax=Psychrobacter sp. UBA3068 TaxID=1947349 RepID=UPI00257EEE5B|nr:hypothetical protein [Psychrobacter sp. UBA3068]